MGSLPVCGGCVVVSVIKHQASMVTERWDDEAIDTLLTCMVEETGMWTGVEGVNIRANSLAVSILLEADGTILEDAYWLCSVYNAAHIVRVGCYIKRFQSGASV